MGVAMPGPRQTHPAIPSALADTVFESFLAGMKYLETVSESFRAQTKGLDNAGSKKLRRGGGAWVTLRNP